MTGPTYGKSTFAAMMTALIASMAPLAGGKLHLYEDVTPITPTTDPATLTEATYGGYAASAAVTFKTVHIDPDGSVTVQITPVEFAPTDATATSVVTQVGYLNAAGDTILASYVLDDPITFGDTNDVHLIGFPLRLEQPTGQAENIVP